MLGAASVPITTTRGLFVFPRFPYTRHRVTDADIDAVNAVLTSGGPLTGGREVEALEEELAVGGGYAVTASSGTAALHLAAESLSYVFGKPDLVLMPSFTFTATARVWLGLAKEVKFVDVDESGLVQAWELVRQAEYAMAAGKRVMIVTVDYAGQLCEYEQLQKLRPYVRLLADSTHAIGARRFGASVHSYVDAAVYSFHPAKHVAGGEGGALWTGLKDVADIARRLRSHGIVRTQLGKLYDVTIPGYNYRMPEITAALVRSQASRLAESLTQRRRIAAKYDSRLPWETSDKWVRALSVLKGNEHAYHLYPVTLSGYINRDRVQDLLSAADIGTAVHYPPVHLLSWIRNQPAWATSGGLTGLRNTEALGRTVLSLPMYPELEDKDVEYITERLISAVEGKP